MTGKKGPQFYLDSDTNSESLLIDWVESLEKNKKRGSKSHGSKSAATVRLLTAGLYLEMINPDLVDLIVKALDKNQVPNVDFISQANSILNGLNLTSSPLSSGLPRQELSDNQSLVSKENVQTTNEAQSDVREPEHDTEEKADKRVSGFNALGC